MRGREYVASLEALDRSENLRLLHRKASRDELVGYPFPASLRSSIEGIRLTGSPPRGSKRVLIVARSDAQEFHDLRSAFEAAGIDATFRSVPEDAAETNAGQREAALLANRSLGAIADHLLGRASR